MIEPGVVLTDQEKKARIILDRACEAFIEIDSSSVILDWNLQAEHIFGYQRLDVIGKTLTDLIIPTQYQEEYIKGLRAFQIEATNSGSITHRTIEILAINSIKQEFYIEMAFFAMPAATNISFCVFLRDISERKAAEEALRNSEERFRLLLSGVTDYAIFMLDGKGTVMTWNKGGEKITGYTEEEIIGKHFSCLYTQEDMAKDKPKQELEFAIKNRRYEEEELRSRKDGSKFWASVVFTPIYDDSKTLAGFAKVTRDITERKKAIDANRAQAELLDLTHDAIMVCDLDGTIRYWNSASEVMYGFTNKEAIGFKVLALLKTELQESAELIEQEVIHKGHWEGEIVRFTKDGHRIILASRRALKTDINGKPSAILEINNDITERKRLEEIQMMLAVELKRSNEELEQFASVVSHDLQEPLRGVMSCLGMIKELYAGKIDDKADKLINYAVTSASQMHALIDDLLILSRVTTKERIIQSTDLLDVFQTVLRNLEVSVNESHAIITQDSLPTLLADSTQLIQLFQNIIGNAIKFRSSNPPEIHIAAKKEGAAWLFSVRDNGIGFESEFAERIFLPFTRLHTRDKYPGTGVGLAICKRIIERHNGRIWSNSEPGKGTTLHFTIGDNKGQL
jgi:PAS domain S-box-containing protein